MTRLDLRSPLLYSLAPELVPFDCAAPAGCALPENEAELLFCFELDREQAQSIEPDKGRLPGKLVFSARGDGKQGDIILPAGMYLFSQIRRSCLMPDREECIDMAVEQQKDGLWERLKPGNRLYIRCLFEDGSAVTQLFRPFTF